MAEQWLSIIEYARRFKISDMTIRRRIKTGKLQAILQDGKYYIPMHETDIGKDLEEGRDNTHGKDSSPAVITSYDSSMPKNSTGMTLVKGHPQPHLHGANFQSSQPRSESLGSSHSHPTPVKNNQIGRPQTNHSGHSGSHHPVQSHHEYANLPNNLWEPLINTPVLAVDTKALLAYCEATVKKASELERKAVDRFKSKIESLEATILAKDCEIKSLRQQIEDMQLLVKVIERKK